jgi:hypothetical protein
MKRLAAASMVAAALAFAGHANAATVTALGAGVMTTDLGGGLADFEGITSNTNPGNSAPPQGSFPDGGASLQAHLVCIGDRSTPTIRLFSIRLAVSLTRSRAPRPRR